MLENSTLENRQTILVWPKSLADLLSESLGWGLWLDPHRDSTYVVPDNLLISIRAISAQIPDLTIETDEHSEIITATGNREYLENMLGRLRGHPLSSQVTDNSIRQRELAV